MINLKVSLRIPEQNIVFSLINSIWTSWVLETFLESSKTSGTCQPCSSLLVAEVIASHPEMNNLFKMRSAVSEPNHHDRVAQKTNSLPVVRRFGFFLLICGCIDLTEAVCICGLGPSGKRSWFWQLGFFRTPPASSKADDDNYRPKSIRTRWFSRLVPQQPPV